MAMSSNRDELKRRAGERAVDYVEDGNLVGLGTGSTTLFAIKEIGRRVQEGLKVTGVPTSKKSEQLALQLGIPLTDLNTVDHLDVVIDGADEIDPAFNMIKGGGGALTREKLVAISATRRVFVVDPPKLVEQLGGIYPLPIEVLPFAWKLSARLLTELGGTLQLREADGKVYETDNGNYILDCRFGLIANPAELEQKIKLLPGVVECGLFIGIAQTLIVGFEEGVEVRHCP